MKKLFKILFIIILGLFVAGVVSASWERYWTSIDNLIPRTDDTVDIGSATKGVRHGYFNDFSCTDCINATEIEDIYVLNTSDTMSGTLGVQGTSFTLGTDGVSANRTQTIWTKNGYEANLKFMETSVYGMGIRYNATANILYMDRYLNSATPSGSNMLYRQDGDTIFEGDTLMIDVSAGRVGIEDITPSYTLDVNGTLRAVGAGTFDSTLGVTGITTLATTTVSGDLTVGDDLFVDVSTGEVGIGVANPLARLHVNYPASGDVIFQSGTGDGGGRMKMKCGYNGYGWYYDYRGDQSGDANEWELWSEGAGGADMMVYECKQSGNIRFGHNVSIDGTLGLATGTTVNDIDITVANDDNALITSGGVYDGLATKQATLGNNDIVETMFKAVNEPVDEYVLTYEATTGDFEWEVDQTGAGGSAIIFDIGDDGGNDSVDVNEIATTGDTNTIFTEPTADKILIAVGNNWPTADLATTATTANAGDAAVDFFGAGVDAVTDATTCTNIEGTHLSITGGTLNVADDWWDALSDLTLAHQSIYVGDASNNPVATSTITILSSGYVGIATTTPSEMLSIGGTGKLLIGNRQSTGGKLRVDLSDADTETQAIKTYITRTSGTNFGYNGTAAGIGADKNVGMYGWAAGATENWGMWVNSGYGIFDDRVGIGDSTPLALLTVGSGDLFQIDTAGVVTFTGTGDIDLPANSIDEIDLKAVNEPVDEYVLTYEATTGDFEWEVDQTGGNTAWDDITNPDAADEIDFAAFITELNVADFRIGDGGSNYVKFDGTGKITFVGTGDIDLPNDSVDAADIATINCGTNCTWDAANDEIDIDDAWWNALTDMVLTDNYIYVGDVSNDPVGVAMSNDCTIASNGAITCDHDALDNFVANEHLDWTGDLGATNLHTGNYPITDTEVPNNITIDLATLASTITVADESADTSCFVGYFTGASGSLAAKTGTNLTFNSSSGILTATGFAGALTGNVTGNCSGSSGTCTGEAATVATINGLAPNTATTQATQGAITSLGTLTGLTMSGDIAMGGNNIDNGGVIFLTEQADADADVAGKGQIWVNTATPNELWWTDDAGTDVQLGAAGATPTDITVADESVDATCFIGYFTAATGDLEPKTGTNITFNSSTGILTASGFVGDITGALTGNADTVTGYTPASGSITLAGADALTITTTAATGVTLPTSGTLYGTAADTISSANLLGSLSDETGTGLAVFGTSPTFLTGITVPNDSISHTELSEGDAFDFTGSVEIPNAAAPTIDAAGEIALDTTDNQLLVADSGNTARVIPLEQKMFSFTMASTSDAFISGGIMPIPPNKDGFSLTKFKCYVKNGTSVVVNISDGTNDTESITCATTLTSDEDVATNDTFTAGELAEVQIGTITGSPDYLTFTAYGWIVRE